MSIYDIRSDYEPTGDQPEAIERLTDGVLSGRKWQTLLGVTGSGKTFTIANVIARCGVPALVISHNKTLAAQLYGEFRSLFPSNAVEYFISYYDYYQPEAFIPSTQTYIEKDVSINEDIDRLRLKATGALMTRRDVIVVASVSCIYGLGSPEEFGRMTFSLAEGDSITRESLLRKLVDIRYTRNDFDFARGTFRVRGDTVEIRPSYMEEAVRIEMFGDDVERISVVDPVGGGVLRRAPRVTVFPSSHFVVSDEKIEDAMGAIERDLVERAKELRSAGLEFEARRIESRTRYDLR